LRLEIFIDAAGAVTLCGLIYPACFPDKGATICGTPGHRGQTTLRAKSTR